MKITNFFLLQDLREAVAMETAQDAMEEMSLKLSGSGVSDSPTDIKVNSVVRFHLEELAEERSAKYQLIFFPSFCHSFVFSEFTTYVDARGGYWYNVMVSFTGMKPIFLVGPFQKKLT